MLKTTNLRNSYWDGIVATTCYVQNGSYIFGLYDYTPLTMWCNNKRQ